MSTEDFPGVYASSCHFVRLHGWVEQSHEHVERLKKLVSQNKEPDKASIDLLLQGLNRLDSVEEKLLTLVILSEARIAPESIAEMLFKQLQGRLTNDDSAFIIRHLFHGTLPVPDEIVYDIIKRNFISYQRAIFQALKVSGFESEFSPAQILLFLTQLLCRNNLNEQNRAMLYLLMSRLDIDLPPALEQTVSKAMTSLADVIKDVEQRLESVLSDPLLPNSISLENLDWEHFVRVSAPTKPKETGTDRPADSPGYEPYDFSQTAMATPAPVAKKPAEPVSGTYFSAIKPDAAPAKPIPEPAKAVGKPPSQPAEPLASASYFSAAEPPGAPAAEAGLSPEPAPPAPVAESYAYDFAPGAVSPGQEKSGKQGLSESITRLQKNFAIKFTRETTEMKRLIRAIQEHEEAIEKPAEADVGADVALVGASELPATASPLTTPGDVQKKFRILRWWWIALAIIATLSLVIAVVWKNALPPMPQSAVVSTPLPGEATLAPSGSAVAASPGTERGAQEPVIKVAGTQTTWHPRKGESLWQLYNWLRHAGTGIEPGLVSLAKGTWQSFLADIVRLNPGLTVPDTIYPNVPIIIH